MYLTEPCLFLVVAAGIVAVAEAVLLGIAVVDAIPRHAIQALFFC